MASYDSSSDSGRSFDEEYFQNKPPPVEYKELSHKIVVVKANNELEKENFEQNGGLKSEQTIKKTAKKRSKRVKNGINDSVVIKNVSIAENINKYHAKIGMEEIKTTLSKNNTKKVVTRTNINKSNSDKLESLKEIVNKLTSQSEKSVDLKPVPTKRANLPLDTCQCDKCISNNYFLTQTGRNNCNITVSNEKKIETGKYLPPTERNQFPSPYDVIKLPTVSSIVDRNKRILMENNIFPCSSTSSSIKSKRTDGNIIIKKAKKEEHKPPSFRNTRDNTLKIRNEFLSPRASFSSTSSNKSNRTVQNEKFQSTNNTKAVEEDKSNFISCFICGETVLLLLINDHLDICLHKPISPSVFSEYKPPSFRNTRDNTLQIRNEFPSPREVSFSSTSSNKSNRTNRNEKFQSTNNTKAVKEDKSNFISCFICGETVLLLLINDHVCIHKPISSSVFSKYKPPSFRNTRDNTLQIRNEFPSPREVSFSSTSSNKSNRTNRNEKFQSTNNTKATEEDKPNFISCFNCGQTVLLLLINDHLDICLHRPISPSVFSEDTLNRNLTHGTCEDLSGRDTIVLVDTFNELENGNSFCGVLKRICCCLCTK